MKEQMKSKSWSLAKNLSSIKTKTSSQYSLKDFTRLLDLKNPKLKKIEALLSGQFTSKQKGEGFDFNEIREYKIGDDLRHISWNTTAKTGNLHTKEYNSEKEIRTYFLIDISNSMFCGSKTNSFTQLFAFLLNISCGFSEKTGGLFFSNDIKYTFPFGNSYSQSNVIFQNFLKLTENLKTKITTTSSKTNISKALEFAEKYFRKKGVIFLISDFIGFERWEKSIYQTSLKQNIYSFQIHDLLDYELPKTGCIEIIDPETHERCFVNTDSNTIRTAYNNKMFKKQDELNAFLKKIGIHHTIIEKFDFE